MSASRTIDTKLTAHQFKCLWALFPDNENLLAAAVQDELKYLRWPHKRGTLDGRPIAFDDQGALASGYAFYEDGAKETILKTEDYKRIVVAHDAAAKHLIDVRKKLNELIDKQSGSDKIAT